MKNPSKKYWEDRAAGRMVGYTAKAESTADTLGKSYYATARYLQGEANDVFNAFTDKFELSIAEAETMLKNAPNKSMFEQMKTALATCTDEQKKQQLETLLSSPAYAHRIGRLNDLDSKISNMCSRLANAEIGVDTEHLGDIIQSAYMQTVFDVTKGADYRAAFDLIPESRVKAILSTNWSGQMFSQRVWDNTNALADGLKHDMLVGIMAGKSEQHMADDIMNRCGVGAFEARRLVRTETTCVANMAELYGYQELDIDEYEFSACLDSRTSDLCRELDGKVFKRNSAQAGVNLPPMHPFCRSTTLPVLPSEENLDKELAELGDEIGADVDFDEWERNLQQGEDGKWRYVAGSVDKVKADKPMRFAGDGVDKSGESGIIKSDKNFKPLPKESVVNILRKKSIEWIKKLTKKEKTAIRKYTKNSIDPKGMELFRRLNAMLRGDTPKDTSLERYADVISSALRKSVIDSDIICYRRSAVDVLKDYEVGDIYYPGQFLSTAVTEKGALNGEYLIVIRVKKGSIGAYIEKLSAYPSQRELLLDKDEAYRIIEKANKVTTIEVIT